MEEIHYAFWLINTLGLSCGIIHRLLDYAGSFRNIWYLSKSELAGEGLKIPPAKIDAIINDRDENQILNSYNNLISAGIRFYHYNHPQFPYKLTNIPGAPMGIYCIGRLPDPSVISVAIIGARTCSEYGRYVARKLGNALGDNGIQVISGLARGVDGIAQDGALSVGGYSCGVLGCGVDICYPPSNIDIYNKLAISGGIISEYPPGTPAKANLFPQRNRIISALSDVVVVIEAREKSGSLITADLALEQGKDIYALPGRVTDSLSHGCNRLIRQGAGIILSPEEFINDLIVNYSLSSTPSEYTDFNQLEISDLLPMSDTDKRILSTITMDPKSINEIQDETSLPTGELMNGIIRLSMKGLILQNGSYYVLKL